MKEMTKQEHLKMMMEKMMRSKKKIMMTEEVFGRKVQATQR